MTAAKAAVAATTDLGWEEETQQKLQRIAKARGKVDRAQWELVQQIRFAREHGISLRAVAEQARMSHEQVRRIAEG